MSATPCHRLTCNWSSHVVLFASGASLCGRPTQPGQMVVFCLKHGGEIYDIIRSMRDTRSVTLPSWLAPDHNRIPRVTPLPDGWTKPASPNRRPWKAAEFRDEPADRAPRKPRERREYARDGAR